MKSSSRRLRIERTRGKETCRVVGVRVTWRGNGAGVRERESKRERAADRRRNEWQEQKELAKCRRRESTSRNRIGIRARTRVGRFTSSP